MSSCYFILEVLMGVEGSAGFKMLSCQRSDLAVMEGNLKEREIDCCG
jgi:hypothetical protein